MKLNATRLQDVTTERVGLDSDAIYDVEQSGQYIGQIVYTRRKIKGGGSYYGWRPAKLPRAKLTDKRGAILRLPNYINPDAVVSAPWADTPWMLDETCD